MGLYTTALIRVLKLLKQYGTAHKNLCMVGRQQLLIDETKFFHIMNKANITYDRNEYESLVKENLIHYDSYRFFRMVGMEEVHAIDVMDEDGADIICDLNEDLPEDLYEKFDYIIDSGTMEHVFDTAKAIRNLSKMLKPGGIVIHILAAAGYIDHGFYSYSPGFFIDYYSSNGFDVLNIDLEFMISQDKWTSDEYEKKLSVYSPDLRVFDCLVDNWGRDDLNSLTHKICRLDEVGHVYIWAVARKEKTTEISYPLQGMYQDFRENASQYNSRDKVEVLYDFEKIVAFFDENSSKKIGIIPAGRDCEDAIKRMYMKDLEDRIYRVFDNAIDKVGTVIRGGFKVFYPTKKKLEELDLMLICSRNYEDEIYKNLKELDISEEKLVKCSKL